MSSGWSICEADFVVRHVIPNDDSSEHLRSAKCPCNPLIEAEENYCIIIHHAFDGREKYERSHA